MVKKFIKRYKEVIRIEIKGEEQNSIVIFNRNVKVII